MAEEIGPLRSRDPEEDLGTRNQARLTPELSPHHLAGEDANSSTSDLHALPAPGDESFHLPAPMVPSRPPPPHPAQASSASSLTPPSHCSAESGPGRVEATWPGVLGMGA